MKDKDLKKLINSIRSAKEPSAYDTPATVTRVDGNTLWVHIPGGVDETPIQKTINASAGDTVQVRVSGGRAWAVGNQTAPPTDDAKANQARQVADKAVRQAGDAQEAAGVAWNYATVASNAASSALTQLSIVEDVAGTLDWITEHGSYVHTTDVTVQPMKIYFQLIDGDYVPITNPDPSVNPSTAGWYELDVSDSQAQYIMAHLAVTSAGLWVLPAGQFAEYDLVDASDNELVTDEGDVLLTFSSDPQNADGYKVLLADSGMTIYDNMGVAVAHYGTTTTIGDAGSKHIYIDNDSVDINDGSTWLTSFGFDTNHGPAVKFNDQYGGEAMVHLGGWSALSDARIISMYAKTRSDASVGAYSIVDASASDGSASASINASQGNAGHIDARVSSNANGRFFQVYAGDYIMELDEDGNLDIGGDFSPKTYTSGNWKYIKLGSLFIGWYATTGTLTIGTQVGSIYSTSSSSTIALPVTLASVLHADVQVANSSYAVWSSLFSATTQTLYYRALSASSRSSATYDITAYVVGTLS